MNFFIRKNSSLPELEYHLTQEIREQYDITNDMLDNVAVTFSMIDAETGLYRIANVLAIIEYKKLRPEYPTNFLYTLKYRFKLSQTTKPGRFLGQFKLDFMGENCGKLTLPTSGEINIIISDSITKTTVV